MKALPVVTINQANMLNQQNNAKKKPETEKTRPSTVLFETDEVQETLKKNKLRKVRDAPINLELARSLFRLLDDDCSGILSTQEFLQGMRYLGFDEVGDPVVLTRLILAIDKDETGTIEEKEFLSFFADHTRSSLSKYLASLSNDTVVGNLLRWSEVDGKYVVKRENWRVNHGSSAAQTATHLNSIASGNEEYVWLDVCGHNLTIAETLAVMGKCSIRDLSKSYVFQEVSVSALRSNQEIIRIIAHNMCLSQPPLLVAWRWVQPFRFFKWLLCGHRDPKRYPNHVADRSLNAGRNVRNLAISLDQVAILVLNPTTIVTLRLPKFACNDPFNQENSVVGRLFENLRTEYLALNGAPVSDDVALTDNIQAFMVGLLDTIVESVNSTRDQLQDWEDFVNADIQENGPAGMTPQVLGLANITAQIKSLLEPLASALDLHDNPEDPAAKKLLQQLDPELIRHIDGLAGNVKKVRSAFLEKEDRIQSLESELAVLKSDMTNRTLYALTLITSIALPFSISTGLWGMNFDDMSELHPETGGFGYMLFYTVVGSLMGVLLFFMNRCGLFRFLM